jgi:hypothetical protein
MRISLKSCRIESRGAQARGTVAWQSAISGKIGYATQPSQNTRRCRFATITASTGWLCAEHTHCPPQKQACTMHQCTAHVKRNLRLLAVCHSSEALPQLAAEDVHSNTGTPHSSQPTLLCNKGLQMHSEHLYRHHSISRRIWETTIVLLSMPQVAQQATWIEFCSIYKLKLAATHDQAYSTHSRLQSQSKGKAYVKSQSQTQGNVSPGSTGLYHPKAQNTAAAFCPEYYTTTKYANKVSKA